VGCKNHDRKKWGQQRMMPRLLLRGIAVLCSGGCYFPDTLRYRDLRFATTLDDVPLIHSVSRQDCSPGNVELNLHNDVRLSIEPVVNYFVATKK
jgi:hypothetical protein